MSSSNDPGNWEDQDTRSESFAVSHSTALAILGACVGGAALLILIGALCYVWLANKSKGEEGQEQEQGQDQEQGQKQDPFASAQFSAHNPAFEEGSKEQQLELEQQQQQQQQQGLQPATSPVVPWDGGDGSAYNTQYVAQPYEGYNGEGQPYGGYNGGYQGYNGGYQGYEGYGGAQGYEGSSEAQGYAQQPYTMPQQDEWAQQPLEQPMQQFDGWAQQPLEQPVQQYDGWAQQPLEQPAQQYDGWAQQPLEQPAQQYDGWAQQQPALSPSYVDGVQQPTMGWAQQPMAPLPAAGT